MVGRTDLVSSLRDKAWCLLSALLIATGVLAIVLTPPTAFVQPAFALGESCGGENPCGEGEVCCGGTCKDDPNDP